LRSCRTKSNSKLSFEFDSESQSESVSKSGTDRKSKSKRFSAGKGKYTVNSNRKSNCERRERESRLGRFVIVSSEIQIVLGRAEMKNVGCYGCSVIQDLDSSIKAPFSTSKLKIQT